MEQIRIRFLIGDFYEKNYFSFFVFKFFSSLALASEGVGDIGSGVQPHKKVDCGGNEPFINVQVRDNQLVVTSPELAKESFKVTKLQSAAARPENHIFELNGKNAKSTVRLTLVSGENVSDGMSDNTYTHQGVLLYNGVIFDVACNLK